MPFPMKIQPLDDSNNRVDSVNKPVLKTRLKRLFKIYEKPEKTEFNFKNNENYGEFEVGTIGLDKMVLNFIEDNNNNENNSKVKIKGNSCNCFNGNNNNNDSSDDEFDEFETLSDALKGLVQCESKGERNLLADSSKIVERTKYCKNKDDLRQIVTVELVNLGYDASICKSKWERSPLYPAGKYEYTDVIVEGERVIIDVDFRSEFEIARSTSSYKSILQALPNIFVGCPDRLYQIISIVSEAAKQSLKKKGMPIPPWRKAEYMRAKWLSPHVRTLTLEAEGAKSEETKNESGFGGDFALIFGEESALVVGEPTTSVGSVWQPPDVKPRSCGKGEKVVVTGLACLLKEKP